MPISNRSHIGNLIARLRRRRAVEHLCPLAQCDGVGQGALLRPRSHRLRDPPQTISQFGLRLLKLRYDGEICTFDTHRFYEVAHEQSVARTWLVNTRRFLDVVQPPNAEPLVVADVGAEHRNDHEAILLDRHALGRQEDRAKEGSGRASGLVFDQIGALPDTRKSAGRRGGRWFSDGAVEGIASALPGTVRIRRIA